ncbi:MAG: hypothetical protein JSR54_01395 [Proteobacteria bacterium]|nr:hypothetical protein [Pseudomonadota bacterium]
MVEIKIRAPLAGAVLALGLAAVPSVMAVAGAATPLPIDDTKLNPSSVTLAGASVLPTTRTIPHWFGTTVNPSNGVTYGYNMVGADPYHCSGSACSVTIEVDITPLIVNVQGMTFDGTVVLQPTLASPLFATNDYGQTPYATLASTSTALLPQGPGGVLSQGDSGLQLQLQDATMRAQFNRTGSSGYHLILHPNVHAPVTINVPVNQGLLLVSGRGVVFADVDIGWWSSQIANLETQADPAHLALYLSNNVLLYTNNDYGNCCVIGYHGTKATGNGGGSTNSVGNAAVQTFAWGSWVQPGLFSRLGRDWALQDIHALTHEIAEWADDPFANNTVQPWLTPTAPQYGCSGLLETGDPVVAIGFAMGVNTFQQGPNPNGSQAADGYYHPEDEVFLPWFMRLAPNAVAEPTQDASSNLGRYTLMGDLNPYPGFRSPATGC